MLESSEEPSKFHIGGCDTLWRIRDWNRECHAGEYNSFYHWGLDVFWPVFTGHHLLGGTEYMWDTRYPLWIRLLSSFHLVLPLVLLWAIRILGYDRRALALQTAIVAAVLIPSRFLSPQLNMNYAFRDPLLHRTWGPAPVHLAVILAGCVAIFFWPTHLVLMRTFLRPSRTG